MGRGFSKTQMGRVGTQGNRMKILMGDDWPHLVSRGCGKEIGE